MAGISFWNKTIQQAANKSSDLIRSNLHVHIIHTWAAWIPLSIWLKVNKHTDEGVGTTAGVQSFKDRVDQSIGDPFRINRAEFLSAALPFLSSSRPARHPEGDRGTRGAKVRGGRRRERKKRTAVLQRCLRASSHSLSPSGPRDSQ